MIYRVSANSPNFKAITFTGGLNIVVADKTDNSTSRNTRNGAGKSSLIEIINFVLGSQCETDDLFRLPELSDFYFSVMLDLGTAIVTASRSGKNPNMVFIDGERIAELNLKTEVDEATGKLYISNTKWREVLGEHLFGLKDAIAGSPTKNRPSYRSLLSYFLRRQSDDGFSEAEKHYKNQNTWDYQVNLSYLFDLDWHIAQEWQRVRDQEKSINALRIALKQGALGGEIIDNAGKLRTQLTIAEKERSDMRTRLSTFKVVEDYQKLEEDASRLTQTINQLADENTSDSLLVRDLRASLESEKPPPKADLEAVYKNVGVELPSVAMERFEAVAAFHNSIIANRQSFLRAEISDAEERMSKRRQSQRKLDEQRSEIMRVLQASGALQQFSALQGELSKNEANVAALENKYEMARQLESQKAELDISRGKLSTRLQRDIDERQSNLNRAILIFEEISKELYQDHGSLTIEATDNGPEFGTVIHAKRSMGKNHMQIFCFDMTIAVLNAGGRMPGFLVHDSHLFDGADERQIAVALSIGARLANEHGFQYLVTLNTDDLPQPSERPEGFDLDVNINPVRLTDATEDGGLFGMRFG